MAEYTIVSPPISILVESRITICKNVVQSGLLAVTNATMAWHVEVPDVTEQIRSFHVVHGGVRLPEVGVGCSSRKSRRELLQWIHPP